MPCFIVNACIRIANLMSKKIRLLPSGKEIEAQEGESVLAALESAGYALPNNCRAGACGECKAKVCSGEIDQGFVLDMALPSEERERGLALMCMARPKSELIEIEYGTDNALPQLFPPEKDLPYIVTEKQPVTPGIIKLCLRSLGEPMRFWPGQYIQMGNKVGGMAPRAYSIANIPNREGEIILFITKVKGGGVSGWVHSLDLMPGQKIEISGPYGTFVGDPSAETSVLCLAAGSGLAPIRSLASGALLRGGFRFPSRVIFSASTRKDLFETGYFAFLEAKFDNFQFFHTLTREKNGEGLTGRIPEILPQLYPHLNNHSVYIAGSDGFVAACTRKVQEMGAAFIHREVFCDQSL